MLRSYGPRPISHILVIQLHCTQSCQSWTYLSDPCDRVCRYVWFGHNFYRSCVQWFGGYFACQDLLRYAFSPDQFVHTAATDDGRRPSGCTCQRIQSSAGTYHMLSTLSNSTRVLMRYFRSNLYYAVLPWWFKLLQLGPAGSSAWVVRFRVDFGLWTEIRFNIYKIARFKSLWS